MKGKHAFNCALRLTSSASFFNYSAVLFLIIGSVAFSAKPSIAQSASDPFELSRTGDTKELKKLLRSKPEMVDTVSAEGYTLLILAAYHGHNETVAFLADKVSDIDRGSGYGTALMGAAVKGNTEVAEILLDNGANPNAQDAEGNTPLTFAAMFENEEMARLLVTRKADPTLKNKKGFSAADYAKTHQNTVLSILFDK